jgi:hypothetical protein
MNHQHGDLMTVARAMIRRPDAEIDGNHGINKKFINTVLCSIVCHQQGLL